MLKLKIFIFLALLKNLVDGREKRLDVVINEINLIDISPLIGQHDSYEFIELRRVNSVNWNKATVRNLKNKFKLIVIENCLRSPDPFLPSVQDPEIMLIADINLENVLNKNNDFFVLGDFETNDVIEDGNPAGFVDMTFRSNSVWVKNVDYSKSIHENFPTDVLPDGHNCPIGVVLLKPTNKHCPHIQHDWNVNYLKRRRQQVIRLSGEEGTVYINEIQKSWHDQIVVSHPPNHDCYLDCTVEITSEQYEFFAKLDPKLRHSPGFKRKGFIHTEHPNGRGLTLNRCTIESEKRSPGLSYKFHLCPRSVRRENLCFSNECTNSAIYTIIEEGEKEESQLIDDEESEETDHQSGTDNAEDQPSMSTRLRNRGSVNNNQQQDTLDETDLLPLNMEEATLSRIQAKIPVAQSQEVSCDSTETCSSTTASGQLTPILQTQEQTPIKKRLRSGSTSVSDTAKRPRKRYHNSPRKKGLILNVIDYVLKKHNSKLLTREAAREVSEIIQKPVRQVYRVWEDANRDSSTPDEMLPQPGWAGGRRGIVVDEFDGANIRRTVLSFYFEKRYPTVRSLHAHFRPLMDSGEFPEMGKSTFHKLLKKQGFSYVKTTNKRFLYERSDITASRHSYLRQMKSYRSQGYNIFWQDETWVTAGHAHSRTWRLNVNKESLLPVEQEGQGGVNVPSGAGKRLIVNHAGGQTGFLEGAKEVFIGETGTGDYHKEMNINHWMRWYSGPVLTALPNRSVFIVDNAKYHNQITEESKRPTTAWRKADIQQWLSDHNVPFLTAEIKAELLKKVSTVHTEKEYVTDKLAKESNRDIKILRLPIAHCELNPIELIWAWVKKKVSDRNWTFKIKDVEELTNDALDEVTPELWQKCIEHVEKVEKEYWDRDGLLDIEVEPLTIEANDDDSDDDDEGEVQESDSSADADEDDDGELIIQGEITKSNVNNVFLNLFSEPHVE